MCLIRSLSRALIRCTKFLKEQTKASIFYYLNREFQPKIIFFLLLFRQITIVFVFLFSLPWWSHEWSKHETEFKNPGHQLDRLKILYIPYMISLSLSAEQTHSSQPKKGVASSAESKGTVGIVGKCNVWTPSRRPSTRLLWFLYLVIGFKLHIFPSTIGRNKGKGKVSPEGKEVLRHKKQIGYQRHSSTHSWPGY